MYRLLYVGRISAEKGGYLELIDAVGRLNAAMPVGLLFVGEGPMRSELMSAINQRGLTDVVSCPGHQSPDIVQQAYASADLVVLPSRGEMMPRVMLD